MKWTLVMVSLLTAMALAGCSPDEEESALDNNTRNQQEFQNTATDPAGPRQISPPSNMANE
ncbi:MULTISPECIES: hypothetical protein [Gammaproteobacteria]|uniref:Lipoprotein n=1 Tax=Stutzerimonas stutzeri TaxID=316 RepID=A0A2N8RHJ1_STUST|nr:MULTISPECIES: hypothetical protein [Gammaproteobacteria]KRW66495.1 hypothetical protein AO741_08800 [Pseudomonas sp. TTU2014-105ASC]MDH2240411.1 hypothetical protein [Pseudomonas sp. GD03909]MDH2246326.1 hypothetical protein [Pseudomonas sp. GD03856]MDH2263430.1 hypothetical protein [Pseudomonas sp. GD03855]EHY77600.1 hypothetical protein PstZobell_09207 [Stutzerimonas stutzeri ATCC 14405 = CCUG 16156]